MVLLIQKRIYAKKKKKKKEKKKEVNKPCKSRLNPLGLKNVVGSCGSGQSIKKVLIVVTSASLYRVLAKILACRAK